MRDYYLLMGMTAGGISGMFQQHVSCPTVPKPLGHPQTGWEGWVSSSRKSWPSCSWTPQSPPGPRQVNPEPRSFSSGWRAAPGQTVSQTPGPRCSPSLRWSQNTSALQAGCSCHPSLYSAGPSRTAQGHHPGSPVCGPPHLRGR